MKRKLRKGGKPGKQLLPICGVISTANTFILLEVDCEIHSTVYFGLINHYPNFRP
jgi:hypothetical protein